MAIIGFKTVLPQEVSTLNPVAGDLYLNPNGTLAFLTDETAEDKKRAAIQGIMGRLNLVKGDYFLNIKEGVPYFTQILVKNPSIPAIKSTIREAILSYPGTDEILELNVSLDRPTRVLTVSFKVKYLDGVTLSSDDFGRLNLKADFDVQQETT